MIWIPQNLTTESTVKSGTKHPPKEPDRQSACWTTTVYHYQMWEKKGREKREKSSKGFFLFSFLFRMEKVERDKCAVGKRRLNDYGTHSPIQFKYWCKVPLKKKKRWWPSTVEARPFFPHRQVCTNTRLQQKEFFFLPRPHKLTKQSFPALLLSPLFSLAENCFPAKRNSNGFSSLSLSLSLNLRVFAGIFVS